MKYNHGIFSSLPRSVEYYYEDDDVAQSKWYRGILRKGLENDYEFFCDGGLWAVEVHRDDESLVRVCDEPAAKAEASNSKVKAEANSKKRKTPSSSIRGTENNSNGDSAKTVRTSRSGRQVRSVYTLNYDSDLFSDSGFESDESKNAKNKNVINAKEKKKRKKRKKKKKKEKEKKKNQGQGQRKKMENE